VPVLTKDNHRGLSLRNANLPLENNYSPLEGRLPEGKADEEAEPLAKVDSVGGKSRFSAIPNYTPHQFTFGLSPQLTDSPSRGE